MLTYLSMLLLLLVVLVSGGHSEDTAPTATTAKPPSDDGNDDGFFGYYRSVNFNDGANYFWPPRTNTWFHQQWAPLFQYQPVEGECLDDVTPPPPQHTQPPNPSGVSLDDGYYRYYRWSTMDGSGQMPSSPLSWNWLGAFNPIPATITTTVAPPKEDSAQASVGRWFNWMPSLSFVQHPEAPVSGTSSAAPVVTETTTVAPPPTVTAAAPMDNMQVANNAGVFGWYNLMPPRNDFRWSTGRKIQLFQSPVVEMAAPVTTPAPAPAAQEAACCYDVQPWYYYSAPSFSGNWFLPWFHNTPATPTVDYTNWNWNNWNWNWC